MPLPMPIMFAIAVLGMVVAGVYVFGLTKRWGILLPFIGLIVFGSMALPLDWNDKVKPTIWLPVQSQRSGLFLAAGIAGSLIVLAQVWRTRGKRLSASALLMLVIGLYAAMMRFVHEGPVDGALSVVFAVATIVPLLFASMLVIDKPDDLRILMRGAVVANIVWLGMIAMQVVIDPDMVTMGNEFRFVGLYSNPQHSGVLMAFFLVISLWMMLNERGRIALLMLGVVGINGLLLLWTGSRTGLGMAIIGVSATLYSRAGRAILLLPLAAIIGYVGLKVMVDVLGITLGFERLTSTANTRDEAWGTLVSVAMENPLFGAGTEGAEKSENSWLYGFASYGFGMLVLLLVLALVASVEILKTVRARFVVPAEYRSSLDFMVGLLLMYFAGAVLEGYMISRVSSTLCFFLTISVANVNIRRMLLGHQGQAMYDQDWDTQSVPYGDDEIYEQDEQLGYAS